MEVRAAALADARRRVDERDLAEPASSAVRIAVEVGRDKVAVLLRARVEPDEPAATELAAETLDQSALERQRERARERPFRCSRVRARERLLGRHVRGDLHAPRRFLLAAEPASAGREPELQVRIRTAQVQSGQLEACELCRTARDRAYVVQPARRALAVLVGQSAEPEKVPREDRKSVV